MASILTYWQYTTRKKGREGYKDIYEKVPSNYVQKCRANKEAPYGDHCNEQAKEFWAQLRLGKDKIYQITQKVGNLYLVCTFIVSKKRDNAFNNSYGCYEATGRGDDPASQFFNPPIDITDLLKKLNIIKGKPRSRAGWAERFEGQPGRFRKLDLGMEKAIEDYIWSYRKEEYRKQNKQQPISKIEDENFDRLFGEFGITRDQIKLGRQGEQWFIRKLEEGKLIVYTEGKQSILLKTKSGKFDRRDDPCGYDFNCIKDGRPIYLEVKAFSKIGGKVFLTRNEWHKAMSARNQYWILGLRRDKVADDFKPILLSAKYLQDVDWEPLTRVCSSENLFGK